jgi:uncharacterized protein YjiS (DUF1127 family)
MTMLSTTTSMSAPSVLRRRAIILLARLRRSVNNWVADVLAHRERQAAIHALHEFSDHQLKDIGLYRGQIENAINGGSRDRMPARRSR